MEENRIKSIQSYFDQFTGQEIRIMEVCGTHTHAISKTGIRAILPKNVQLLSGPGCPVCVTTEAVIDMALEILEFDHVILATFGDMMKVKGSCYSLSDKNTHRSKIKVIYSPEEVLSFAMNHTDINVVLVAVGFETTAPLIALTVKLSQEKGIKNLYFLTALKCMEPAIRYILLDDRHKINAILCPGHVASIKGAEYFRFITEEFSIPAVVCGFNKEDIVAGLNLLLEQITGVRKVEFHNLYQRCVTEKGNTIAQSMIKEVFDIADGDWRGIGTINNSAFVLKDNYKHLDAMLKFGLKIKQNSNRENCLCSEIILGRKLPYECGLFGDICTPEHPLGPCMISSEGACSAHFKYGGKWING